MGLSDAGRLFGSSGLSRERSGGNSSRSPGAIELEEGLGAPEVLEPMRAEVAHAARRRAASPRRGPPSPSTAGPGRRGRPPRCARHGGPRSRRGRSGASETSPEWTPMRTRSCSPPGHSCSASSRCIWMAAATQALGEVNVAKNESPWVPSSLPPCARSASRMIRCGRRAPGVVARHRGASAAPWTLRCPWRGR